MIVTLTEVPIYSVGPPKEYQRILSEDDIKKGTICGIGVKIIDIRIELDNNKDEIDIAIDALKMYREKLKT